MPSNIHEIYYICDEGHMHSLRQGETLPHGTPGLKYDEQQQIIEFRCPICRMPTRYVGPVYHLIHENESYFLAQFYFIEIKYLTADCYTCNKSATHPKRYRLQRTSWFGIFRLTKLMPIAKELQSVLVINK